MKDTRWFSVDGMERFGDVVMLLLLPLLLGAFLGGWVGYGFGLTSGKMDATSASLAAVLAKPLEVRVSLSGAQSVAIAPRPSAVTPLDSRSTPSNNFLSLLARKASEAIGVAQSTVKEKAAIPATAAKKFLDSLASESGKEAGKELVHFFSYLVSIPFGKGQEKDPDKEAREVFAIIIQDYVRETSWPTTEYVLFEINHAKLAAAAYKSIGNARARALADPNSIVLLSGNTDTTGSPEWNMALAQKRLRAVRDALIAPGGIAPNRIFSAELALAALPVVTPLGVGEQRNRSVKIEVR